MGATKIAYKPASRPDFAHNTRLPSFIHQWPPEGGRRMTDSA